MTFDIFKLKSPFKIKISDQHHTLFFSPFFSMCLVVLINCLTVNVVNSS